MRDPVVIDALEALERYARAFDEISAEQDAHYSARSFVRWVRLEVQPPNRMLTECSQNPGNGTGATGTATRSARRLTLKAVPDGTRRDGGGGPEAGCGPEGRRFESSRARHSSGHETAAAAAVRHTQLRSWSDRRSRIMVPAIRSRSAFLVAAAGRFAHHPRQPATEAEDRSTWDASSGRARLAS